MGNGRRFEARKTAAFAEPLPLIGVRHAIMQSRAHDHVHRTARCRAFTGALGGLEIMSAREPSLRSGWWRGPMRGFSRVGVYGAGQRDERPPIPMPSASDRSYPGWEFAGLAGLFARGRRRRATCWRERSNERAFQKGESGWNRGVLAQNPYAIGIQPIHTEWSLVESRGRPPKGGDVSRAPWPADGRRDRRR